MIITVRFVNTSITSHSYILPHFLDEENPYLIYIAQLKHHLLVKPALPFHLPDRIRCSFCFHDVFPYSLLHYLDTWTRGNVTSRKH